MKIATKVNLTFFGFIIIFVFCVSDNKCYLFSYYLVIVCNISSTSSFYFSHPPSLERGTLGVLLLRYICFWYTRILHESFMLLYVWLYATFDGDRPLLILLFFARIYYDSFMLLAYGFMPLRGDRPPFWSCCSLHVFIAMLVFITNYEKLYVYRIIRLEWG